MKMSAQPSPLKSATPMPMPLPDALPKPARVGHVLEFAAAQVAIEAVRHRRVGLRVAIEVDAVLADAALVAAGGPEGVVREHQVETAVVVVVEPGALDAERVRRLGAEPGCRGDIAECAVAVVAIKRVRAGVGDEQIREAVVVEVARGGAEAVAEVSPASPPARSRPRTCRRPCCAAARCGRSVVFFSPGTARRW